MFKKIRLSVVILLAMLAVAATFAVVLRGCGDIDEALPHYQREKVK